MSDDQGRLTSIYMDDRERLTGITGTFNSRFGLDW